LAPPHPASPPEGERRARHPAYPPEGRGERDTRPRMRRVVGHSPGIFATYTGQAIVTLVILIFVIEFSIVLLFLILLKKFVFTRKNRQNKKQKK
jgi:hypothetical protein